MVSASMVVPLLHNANACDLSASNRTEETNVRSIKRSTQETIRMVQ
jgi:hypothetical protein